MIILNESNWIWADPIHIRSIDNPIFNLVKPSFPFTTLLCLGFDGSFCHKKVRASVLDSSEWQLIASFFSLAKIRVLYSPFLQSLPCNSINTKHQGDRPGAYVLITHSSILRIFANIDKAEYLTKTEWEMCGHGCFFSSRLLLWSLYLFTRLFPP